jgi:prepilin-type N-terminal cleavage/methylation domain-containing protein
LRALSFSRANGEVEMKQKTLDAQRPALNAEFEQAFTLLELLVVIAVIAVLAVLSFPAVQSILERAKKVQAKNDLTQIVTAVNAFYTEYGRYPTTATTDATATYGGSTSSKALFDELRAKTTNLNTRQIVFISPPEDAAPGNPKGKIGTDGQFHDPWSSAYWIEMDADYDNQIANPYGGNGGAGVDPLRHGAIAWSLGKDAKLGNNGNNLFKDTNGTQSDDVISWQ